MGMIQITPMLQDICESFGKIERHRLKVDRIELPENKMDAFFTEGGAIYRDSISPAPPGWLPNVSKRRLEAYGYYAEDNFVGYLFGAKLCTGPIAKVVSSPEFGPVEVPIEFLAPLIRKIRRNLTIIVKHRGSNSFLYAFPKNEQRAISTLRDNISEKEFRKYIKYGFISIIAASGKIYQIHKCANHIRVWYNGKLVEEVCAYIEDNKMPFTDKVIAFKTMIESDEEEFRKLGNVYRMTKAA